MTSVPRTMPVVSRRVRIPMAAIHVVVGPASLCLMINTHVQVGTYKLRVIV